MKSSLTTRRAKRASTFRKLGWLSAASMLAAATLAPATASAVSIVNWATVTGYAAGTSDNNHEATWGRDCTKVETDNLGSMYLLHHDYTLVIVKAGSEQSAPGHVNTEFANASAGQTVWADSDGSGDYSNGDKGISHIIFCGMSDSASDEPSQPTGSEEPTATASDEPSQPTESEPTGSEEPTATASDEPSQPTESEPTGSEEPTQSASEEPSQPTESEPTGSELPATGSPSDGPSGGVEGATGTPGITPPPTDTIAAIAGGSGDGWRIVLYGLALVIVAALTFTTPRKAVRTKR